MKAIVIREPYVSLLLTGEKTWEMRKAACRYRGPVALISKGSGTVVGAAEIVDSLPSIDSLEAYAQAEPKHRVPPNLQSQAFSDGWRTPWVVTRGHRLASPVPYKHPSGAVIWVSLDQDVAARVMAQIQQTSEPGVATGRRENVNLSSSYQGSTRSYTSSSSEISPLRVLKKGDIGRSDMSDEIRRVTITGGNIRNNHIYLPLDFFPQEAIGGNNKFEPAARTVSVTFRPGQTIETDIDRTKRILRARRAVGDFFAAAGVEDGDVVRLIRIDAFCYEISKETNG
ncbi:MULTISPECIES: ASCH domain-containing protein [unclassified Bradyrhizobium]|uniref:ASCH domain-containing protein n=1 Tax=unclassified Bradyrhizobium TaxID=2631580 RepID=UPI001FF902F8|nr:MULTISPECIES: ASCH domain-containing protein [unclassified Bradyrhizobium]MCK1534201.1 ASCH domain-containing protein [Bradyrhizobium sp. 176]MCK1562121.1 ASCH domain-containing protein [Bradyrhizobium sp. 171]